METSKAIKNQNLKLVKKVLMKPSEFAKTDYAGKACFTKDGYTKYGCFESWETALNILSNLPDNENNCDELIMPNTKVKPYVDIEYIKEENPNLHPDDVKIEVMNRLIQIFKEYFNFKLAKNDIYFAECHRKKNDTYKYSFHVVVCTEPMIVFENTNKASYVAHKLREYCNFNEDIIDLSVYKKRQNFRLVGHCKPGESKPFRLCNGDDYKNKMVLTNITRNHIVLEAEEQADFLDKTIKNKGNYNLTELSDEDHNYIIEKVKEKLHPTAYLETIDATGFFQFNYTDRNEPCFCHQNTSVYHDRIGFFVYIYNSVLYAGCHSGNCIEQSSQNGKIRKIIYRDIGSLKAKKNDVFLQKVSYDNKFELDPTFVFECVKNNAFGISNLFREMYLNPKRIKWVSGSSRNGTTYFWDGNLWIEDDFSYVERLLAATVVRVLRDVLVEYSGNEDINNFDGSFEQNEDPIVNETQKIIKSLNSGMMIKNVLKFFQPLIRDTEFLLLKDQHPHFLSCKNGMVNLYTGELRKAVPDDNITKTLDLEYNEDINPIGIFDEFVRQITSDESGECEDVYNYLRWCIGYSMQGNPTKKVFFLFFGPHGFNGKSMFMNTIADVLGSYASHMDRSVVMKGPKKAAGSHSTELVQLEYARIGILNDTEKDDTINDGNVKQLTGITDKISIRQIFEKQREFVPKFVPFISSNHQIGINLYDKAMYERFVVIPFKLSFVDNPTRSFERKADSSLADKFKQNKEQILRWLVDCSIYYNQNPDMQIPKTLLDAKKEYNEMVNPYVNFINNNFEGVIGAKVTKSFLLEKYKFYCMQNSIKFISKSSEEEFDKLLKVSKTSKGKVYLDIQFKRELDEEDDEVDILDA